MLLLAASKIYFVVFDNMSNVISVINIQENTVNSDSPFGELIVEQEQVKLNIGFNTKYEDASGLIYYNNRYYDSDLGRFISQDPIFEEGGVNLYNFVENDPINHWDILGYQSMTYTSYDNLIDYENEKFFFNSKSSVEKITNIEVLGTNVANQALQEYIQNHEDIFGRIDMSSLVITTALAIGSVGIASAIVNLIASAVSNVVTTSAITPYVLSALEGYNTSLIRQPRAIVLRATATTDIIDFSGIEIDIKPCTYTLFDGTTIVGTESIYSVTGEIRLQRFNTGWQAYLPGVMGITEESAMSAIKNQIFSTYKYFSVPSYGTRVCLSL